jgi:hypothetical protein
MRKGFRIKSHRQMYVRPKSWPGDLCDHLAGHCSSADAPRDSSCCLRSEFANTSQYPHLLYVGENPQLQGPRPPVVDSSSIDGSQSQQYHLLASSGFNSQESLNAMDQVLTPPSDMSVGNDSQESQLRHVPHLATVQERLPEASSRKRMADGVMKRPERSSASPVRGHSRNASSVSVASTTGSRIGEVEHACRSHY